MSYSNFGSSRRGRQGNGNGRVRTYTDEMTDVQFEVTSDLPSSSRAVRRGPAAPRSTPYSRPPAGNVDGNWSHDLYEGNSAPIRRPGAEAAGPDRNSITTLIVENLHWNVTEQDMWDLMRSTGYEVKEVRFRYDNAGRSEGIAEVDFFQREGAEAAVEQYNGQTLDGQNMHIKIIRTRAQPAARRVTVQQKGGNIASRLGPAPGGIMARVGGRIMDRLGAKLGSKAPSGGRAVNGGGSGSGGAGRGGRGGRAGAGGRGRRAAKGPPTADSLDAEMDAYMKGDDVDMMDGQGTGDLGATLVGRRNMVSYQGNEAPPNADA